MSGYTVITQSDELYHYGVLGMKWGVRNYQNKDGSLKPAAKGRYSRGKQYAKERGEIWQREERRLLKESSEYKEKIQALYQLTDKYELDGDDGGGGNTKKYSEKELAVARKKFWEYSDDLERLEEKYEKMAKDKASKQIIEKYGDTAISDLDYYKNVSKKVGLSTFLTIMYGVPITLLVMNQRMH